MDKAWGPGAGRAERRRARAKGSCGRAGAGWRGACRARAPCRAAGATVMGRTGPCPSGWRRRLELLSSHRVLEGVRPPPQPCRGERLERCEAPEGARGA